MLFRSGRVIRWMPSAPRARVVHAIHRQGGRAAPTAWFERSGCASLDGRRVCEQTLQKNMRSIPATKSQL